MSLVSWKLNIDGTWSNAADWSGGVLPGAADDVVLDTRSYHTITYAASAGSTVINSLTAITDSLTLTGGTLTILAGASFGQNLTLSGGTLDLNGPKASVAGTLSVSQGAIALSATTLLALAGPASFGDSNPDGAVLDGGTLATSGTTVVQTDGNQADAGLVLGGGASWINSGIVDADGSVGTGDGVGATATLTNLAGAQFDLATDSSGIEGGGYYDGSGNYDYGTSAFSNAGIFAKTGGSNASTVASVFTNIGVIDAATGTIAFTGGGVFGGTLTGAGQIAFDAGSVNTLTVKAVLSVANLSVSDSATLSLAGAIADAGSVALNNGGVLALAAGASSIAGGFSQTGNAVMELGGGTLSVRNADFSGDDTLTGTGTLKLAGATALGDQDGSQYFIQGGATLVNSGSLTIAQTLYFQDQNGAGNALVNQAGSVIQTGGYSIFAEQSGADTLTNAGSIEDLPGSFSTTYLDPFVVSTGAIEAESGGVIEFDGGGSLGGTLGGAGQIDFGGGVSTLMAGAVFAASGSGIDGGTLVLQGAFAYAGMLSITGGLLQMADSANLVSGGFMLETGTLALGGGGLLLSNAQFGDNASVGGPGILSLAGTTAVGDGDGGEITLYGGATVANNGTLVLDNTLYFQDQAATANSVVNLAAFEIAGDYDMAGNDGADSFSNAGTLVKNAGTGTSDITAAFLNTGLVDISTKGTLDFSGGGSFAGTLTGARRAVAAGSEYRQRGERCLHRHGQQYADRCEPKSCRG